MPVRQTRNSSLSIPLPPTLCKGCFDGKSIQRRKSITDTVGRISASQATHLLTVCRLHHIANNKKKKIEHCTIRTSGFAPNNQPPANSTRFARKDAHRFFSASVFPTRPLVLPGRQTASQSRPARLFFSRHFSSASLSATPRISCSDSHMVPGFRGEQLVLAFASSLLSLALTNPA